MRIYLAGKMDEQGIWRDALLEPNFNPAVRHWHVEGNADALDYCGGPTAIKWPNGTNRLVLGAHEYTGPYRSLLPGESSKNTGYAHGNEGQGQHGMLDSWEEHILVETCFYRIAHSDLVFAYLNTFDSFGTLLEIGYALARGKFVALVESDAATGDESLWFASSAAHLRKRYAPCHWTEHGPVAYGPEHERAFLRTTLLEAISQHAANTEVNAAVAARHNHIDVRAASRQSFQQIARWTSDPRVRDEARRMIDMLDKSAA